MAPITRSGVSSSAAEGLQLPHPATRYREVSWQFVPPQDAHSDRELSEEPASSYDEDADMMSHDDGRDEGRELLLQGPEDHEDVLHPLREAANRVGREVEKFAEVLDGYNPQQAEDQEEKYDLVMDLVDLYYEIAVDTVRQLRDRHDAERRDKAGSKRRKQMRGFEIHQDEFDSEDFAEPPLPDSQTTLADLERWEEEAQTWDLLRRLLVLRYPPPGIQVAPKSTSTINKYSSGRERWNHFLEVDTLALERQTVLEWLQEIAAENGEDIDILAQDLQQNAERGDLIAHGWIHTREEIKKEKRLHSWNSVLDLAVPEIKDTLLNSSKTGPLITQLDPDTPTRQHRSLEVADQHFERAIWLGCYEMLRRGKSPAEIREWCAERTEIWRAVSMSGLPGVVVGDWDIADPASWVLWRRMCFALARNGGGDDYERAVYGILSGDISSAESVCKSWNDFVFIHYNALLRSQFDSYLQKTMPQSSIASTVSAFGIFDAVQFHGEQNGAGRRLVETVKNNRKTSTEAARPMKMLQGVLIADDFKKFVHQQGLAIAQIANADVSSNVIPKEKEQPDGSYRYISKDDHDALRVLTHVLLIFKHLGVDLGGIWSQNTVENIIVSYVSFLRYAGKEELIPLYCSQLNGPRRYATLSRNLVDITDPEQRLLQIKLMRELGLNVQEFVKNQARFLFADYPDNAVGYPASNNFRLFTGVRGPDGTGVELKEDFIETEGSQVPREDILLIRSFEWYLLVDGLWSETFEVGAMLYMRFFKHVHLNSAKSLSEKVSSSQIALSKTRALIGETVDFSGLEGENEDMTEVLDGSADRRRLLKRQLVELAKPFREFEALISALDLIETARGVEVIMLEEQQQLNRWDPQSRKEFARLYDNEEAIMQPLFNKWLFTCPDERWEEEFTHLREAYLPETILAYLHTLRFAGSALTRNYLMKTMDLAALIAEENSDVLQLFQNTGRMQELVQAFADASKDLLVITSERKGAVRSRGKQTRFSGWQQDLWNVKP